MRKIVTAALVSAALAGCQTDDGGYAPPPARSPAPVGGVPGDIADLVGARGSSGETQLQARGYTLARTAGLTAYWWNARSGICAQVATGDGRYQSIVSVAPSLCGAAGASAGAGTPQGGGASGLADLVGGRGAGGETELMARGYSLARTAGLTAFWWNAATGSCVRVVTSNGRYQSIDDTGASECRA